MFKIRDLEEIIKDLYINYPLFGYVLIHVDREENKSLPTAAVYFKNKNKNLCLGFNPEFMSSLTYEEQKATVSHEIFHIILKHLDRFFEEFGSIFLKDLANIACDCSVNQLLKRQGFSLPEGTITLDSVNKMVGEDLNKEDSAEYYYNALMNTPNIKNNLKAFKELLKMIDNHAKGDHAKGEGGKIPQKYRDIIDKAINKQKTHEMNAGTEPGQSIISILLERTKVLDKNVWKKLVRKNFSSVLSSDSYYKYNHPSRRCKDFVFGKKRKIESQSTWVIIDTSGSTQNALSKFVSQINAAMKGSNILVNLVECDAEVQKVMMSLNKIKNDFKLHGGGGTDLNKALDYIHENSSHKKDRIVVLTDGYTPWNPYPNMDITAIYTYNHKPLEKVRYSAVLR